jgi:3-oxoadipate enol-lactonase
VQVKGRGEFFLRDTGEAASPTDPRRPAVMLLHGWFASADLNWLGVYGALAGAGYRVLAIDHRGHGRGLRPLVRFRLADCAADTAAVLKELEVGRAIIVGYSMGGAIAQLVARDHLDAASAIVLSGTAQHWQEPELRNTWRAMGLITASLSAAPRAVLNRGLKQLGLSGNEAAAAWLMSEITRHSPRDVGDAGRELGRFDSRPWLQPLPIPAAVVVTSKDGAVPPHKQHELARALNAAVFEAPIDHLEVVSRTDSYNPVLLEALAAVSRSPSIG